MTEPPVIEYPERVWGDEELAPALPPLVLVSSRDGRGDPVEVPNRNAAWRSMVSKATAGGWECRVTYALAWLADRFYGNGNIAKAAHHVHSVAVRMTRGAERAVAVWWRETTLPDLPLDEWAGKLYMFGHERRPLGAREFKARLT